MNAQLFCLRHQAAALAMLQLVCVACDAADISPATNMEKHPMNTSPSTSRPSAPEVSPIESAGVRYQQDSTDERQGDQDGGYLVAIDVKTGERLWRQKVYEVPDSRSAGVEMGGIYFSSMRLISGSNELEIENEVGGVYRVDLASHRVQKLSGPPDEVPPTPVKPKPTPE
jgi:hypothetical protein